MLYKLEETAFRLRPYRLKLIVAMIAALVGGFLLASKIDQTIAVAVRTVAMALAWWCWCLFLMPSIYTPENRATIENSMFPRFASFIGNFVTTLFLILSIGIVFVAIASVLSLLLGGG